jgi:hypothetical protein
VNNLTRVRRIIGLLGIFAERNPELSFRDLSALSGSLPDYERLENLERLVGWGPDVPLHLYIGSPGVELPAQETAVVEMMEPFEVSMTDTTILVRDCREPTGTPPVALFRLDFPDATMHADAFAKELNEEHQEAMRERAIIREINTNLPRLTTSELITVSTIVQRTIAQSPEYQPNRMHVVLRSEFESYRC